MKPLRGIVIGAGYFSRFQYEAWHRLPGVEIVAALNRTPEKLNPIAAEFGIPRLAALDELEAIVDELQPDFADIITPPETHLDLCTRLGPRGLHLICQKPLAPTWDDCVALARRCRSFPGRVMVHENWRWQPWYREMKRQLDAGAIGDLFSLGVRMRMGDGWGENAYLARQPFFRDYPRLLLYETGVHFFDAFRYLAGEPTRVYARTRRLNPVIEGEDSAQVVVSFASGATAILDANRYNESVADDARYTFGTVRLDGSCGHLELAEDGTLTLKALGESAQEVPYPHEHRNFASDCVYALQAHFVEALRDGTPFASTPDDYLRTTRMVEAAYASAASGEAVSVDAWPLP